MANHHKGFRCFETYFLFENEAQKGSFAAGGAGGLQPFPRALLAVPGLRTVLGSERGVVKAGNRIEGPGAPGAQSLLPELPLLELSMS